MTKLLKIDNPWLINPFFYFGFMWLLSIIGYLISPSKYCLRLDNELLLFLTFTIVVSIAIALIFNGYIKNKVLLIEYEKPSIKIILILVSMYLLDILGSGGAPLFTYLFQDSGVSYNKFGVKTLHVIIVTFTIFCVAKYALQYAIFKKKETYLLL